MNIGELHFRDNRPGERRTACPECARAKHRPRDSALAVKVDVDGSAVWTCHRCGWKGGIWRCRDCGEWRSTEEPHKCPRKDDERQRETTSRRRDAPARPAAP